MIQRTLPCWLGLLLVQAVSMPAVHAGGMLLGDICRLQGQEINTLQGLGLVVGLEGTGDPEAGPTARALAWMMELMGGQMTLDQRGRLLLDDVENAKNVALVFVTAEIPAVGAVQGDRLNVKISAISAKSLAGGYLMMTPLLGPRPDNPTVYALAQGNLLAAPDGGLTTATIQRGAKMEATVNTSFHAQGEITLILDHDFAGFDTTQRIEDEINNLGEITGLDGPVSPDASARRVQAHAMDQLHVTVPIPPVYQNNPIKFVSLLLNIPIQLPSNSSRVVINERDGVVVIGEDVEIAPVLITHNGLRIEATAQEPFRPVQAGDASQPQPNAKLKSLADALNALNVPTEDLIAIIKTLKRQGDLYGEVIFL